MRTDLLLDANDDLPIYVAGLMPFGVSDGQHQRDMFASFPGEWKQFIFNGIGVSKYLKATGNKILALKNIATQQLANDGYNISKINVAFDSTGKLIIGTNTIT